MPTIDDYLANVRPEQRAELERLRSIVKQVVPDAEESISYGLPAFKYHGKPLIYFGAFKNHMSVFPTAKPTKLLKDKLTAYTVSKGTIQFTLDTPLPKALIKEIIDIRLADISDSR